MQNVPSQDRRAAANRRSDCVLNIVEHEFDQKERGEGTEMLYLNELQKDVEGDFIPLDSGFTIFSSR